MKLVFTTLFLILIAATPAFSLREQDYEPSGEPNFKKVNGFSAYLTWDDYPHDYLQRWLDPVEIPTITAAPTMQRGKTMGAFVELKGCQQNARRVCNTRVNYAIYKPDGSIFTTRAVRQRELLWKRKARPKERRTLRGLARMYFKLGKQDPDGEYKVKAKVTDLNADISFEIEVNFDLR